MINKLNTIKLPGSLIIENQFIFTGVRSVVEMSLGGIPIIWEDSVLGRPFDLISGELDGDQMSGKDLGDLQELAAVVDATYTLRFNDIKYTVRFRNEDTPTITAVPIVPRAKKGQYEYYNQIRIKLMVA